MLAGISSSSYSGKILASWLVDLCAFSDLHDAALAVLSALLQQVTSDSGRAPAVVEFADSICFFVLGAFARLGARQEVLAFAEHTSRGIIAAPIRTLDHSCKSVTHSRQSISTDGGDETGNLLFPESMKRRERIALTGRILDIVDLLTE